MSTEYNYGQPCIHKQVGIELIPISLKDLWNSLSYDDYKFDENVIAIWRIKWKKL